MRINNVPTTHKRFVVARIVDGECWYWGSWDNADDAQRIATELEGDCVVAYDLYVAGELL